VATNTNARTEINNIFGENNAFDTPKPVELLKLVGKIAVNSGDILLDFFAGSGTTGHALINLNKEDNNGRKYILVEMGEYFDTVLKPRIQKIMFSNNWKEGKPQSNDGVTHIFKYQCLEQYEDTLNNIEFKEAGSYQRTLSEMEGYFLRYMLDFETRDSPCRFNVEKLTKPFDYTLKITHRNEMKDEKVDLVETFNYLLGIHVRQIKTFNNNGMYYRVVFGRKNEDEIAIIWRDTENIDLKADKSFIEGTILSDIKPSMTYINADFYVEGAMPIEPEFKKLMVV
jgi:adenine-specific DNA-methyltransferase